MISDTASDTADTADTARVTACYSSVTAKVMYQHREDIGSENGGRRTNYDVMVHFLLWWVH